MRRRILTLLMLAWVLPWGLVARGQSKEALLNKLVSKGILSTAEAEELKRESTADASKAWHVRTGQPDWVSALKINGEFRARYEGFFVENPAFTDRNRFRYRLRLGATAVLAEDFEIGTRLMSGEPAGGFGGDPLSGNTTLQDNASKKFVYLDLAYARWTPLRTMDWNASLTFGKLEIPFAVSEMVLDDEYTPEGAAMNLAWKPSPSQGLKAAAAAFVLDELSASSRDPWLFAAQLRWDAAWSKRFDSTLGVTTLAIAHDESLLNGAVPNGNRGNTRDISGATATGFNPVNIDASLTLWAQHFPGWQGAFPIKAGGEFMINPAATERNTAWFVGAQLGKAGHKGQWEVSYRWKAIEADAWYEEVMDSDFGAYYAAQLPNSGFAGSGAGFGAGTNVRGHVIKAAFSPTDALTLLFACYLTRLIDEPAAGADSRAVRVQASALWKF